LDKPKIFVRERRKVKEGEKKPRFAVVGVAGTDLKLYVKHIRKTELKQIADLIGADVVYLEACHCSDSDEDEED